MRRRRLVMVLRKSWRQAKPHEPIAWYPAYRHVVNRATCEAVAEAMGIVVEPPEYPHEDVTPHNTHHSRGMRQSVHIQGQFDTPSVQEVIRRVLDAMSSACLISLQRTRSIVCGPSQRSRRSVLLDSRRPHRGRGDPLN